MHPEAAVKPAWSSVIGSVAGNTVVGGLLALLVGLPLVVDANTTLDTLHAAAGITPRTDGIVLADPVAIAAVPGLVLHSAYVTSLDGRGIDDRTASFLVEGGRLTLDLTGREADRLVADSRPGESGPSLSRPTAEITARRLSQLAVRGALVRRAELVIRGADGRTWTLSNVTAELAPPRKGAQSLDILATYAEQRVKLTLAWGTEPGGHRRTPLRARLESRLLDVRFEGHLSQEGGLRLEGAASADIRKVRPLARWLGVPVDASPDLRDASIVGTVDWSDGTLSFERADVRIDGNQGTGTLALKTGGPRPSIEGTVGFEKLDVGRYVANLLGEPEAGPRLPDTRLLLAVVDADLRLSAARVTAPQLETGRAAVTLTLRNGRLQADLAELEIERGRAQGHITIDMGSDGLHRLAVKGRAVDIDPGRVFAPHLKRNPLFGRANVSIDVHGSGTSLPAMLANLAGKGSFTLADGGKLGLDLRTLVYAAQSSQIVGWAAAGKGSTSLDTLEGRFAIAKGGITIEALAARSGSTSYMGTGKVDLSERLLDLVLTLGPVANDATQSMREALAIRGTWFDPAISLLRQPASPSGSAGTPLLPQPSVQFRH